MSLIFFKKCNNIHILFTNSWELLSYDTPKLLSFLNDFWFHHREYQSDNLNKSFQIDSLHSEYVFDLEGH